MYVVCGLPKCEGVVRVCYKKATSNTRRVLHSIVLNYPLALYTYIQRNSDCDSNRARKICNGNESLAFYYAQWEKNAEHKKK